VRFTLGQAMMAQSECRSIALFFLLIQHYTGAGKILNIVTIIMFFWVLQVITSNP